MVQILRESPAHFGHSLLFSEVRDALHRYGSNRLLPPVRVQVQILCEPPMQARLVNFKI